jgi:hypothetical protein
MSEFYSEILTYGPAILDEAVHQGDAFEKFKIALKFAFSILHNLTLQDTFAKKPSVPIVGETYEGNYLLNEVSSIFMETDYLEHTV